MRRTNGRQNQKIEIDKKKRVVRCACQIEICLNQLFHTKSVEIIVIIFVV